MENIPNKIYLQVGERCNTNFITEQENDFKNFEKEITWCRDRINKNDIVFYRKKTSKNK